MQTIEHNSKIKIWLLDFSYKFPKKSKHWDTKPTTVVVIANSGFEGIQTFIWEYRKEKRFIFI